MPTELKSDAVRGVSVAGQSVYFSLGSPHWINVSGGPFAPYTYHYSKPGEGWKDGEMATLNMANWGGGGKWYSAEMRLDVALGFGSYEQSIKVGSGSGVTTAFYLSEYDARKSEPRDQVQEIDLEFSGHGTQNVQTNVWWQLQQHPVVAPLWTSPAPNTLPDSTSGWGASVYRYRIDWEPHTVTWSVDRGGSGGSYDLIRSQDMSAIGSYDESLCYPYISFWTGWTPDGSPFLKGADSSGKCGDSGACYQAFCFQSLKFSRSKNNRLITLAG
ncbi:MAG: family 16 glycosylhydrolase [Bryobacteraceae bacterium]